MSSSPPSRPSSGFDPPGAGADGPTAGHRTAGDARPDAERTTVGDFSHSRTSPFVRALWAQPAGGAGPSVHDSVSLASWKHYEDLRLLGEGGMGRIFKALDPALKRPVALKFLRREAPELVTRFVLEAQHQAMVDHPNVCKVYEVGEWQGQSYIAMQFIDGQTLEEAGRDLGLMEKVEVMESVAEAIHVAHRQDLIHRDLKPANIMVERTGEGGWKPYVLDFGLARGSHSPGLTEHGFVFGTAHYMAPEQVRGETARVGRRTDVYALGATLYKLLTGDPPFPGKDALECMRRAAQEDPRPVRKLAPGVPADLETIVMKCLEKEPERRYDSARALAEDLRRFREGDPILSHPPSWAYRLGKRARKHRALFAVSIAAALAILVLAALGLQARVTASARAQWAQHFGQQAEQIEALIRYAHLLPRHDIRSELAQVREMLQSMEQDAADSGTAARGPAAYAIGRGHLALGEPQRAKESLERAWSLGFRAPEVSYALGRAYGALYQQEMDRARRIADLDLREARLRDLERQYRAPSLYHLRIGGRATLEPPAYREALLAFYDQDHEEALRQTREAFRARPWFYEAVRLEGEILLAQAGARPQEAEALLETAIQRFDAAQGIAPSDAALLLGEARCWRQRLDQEWWKGSFSGRTLDSGLHACAMARVVEPDLPDAYALEAGLHAAATRYRSSKGEDVEASIQAARSLAERALASSPDHLEALNALAAIESRCAKDLWFSGRDPLEAWERSFRAGERALAVDPMDVPLLMDLSRARLQCMAYKARRGLAYQADWEASAALMERAAGAMPDNQRIQELLGSTYIEWAEQESLRGRDPEEALRKAIRALDRALELHPASARACYFLACADLIQGEVRMARGEDPGALLDRAAASGARALERKPDYVEALTDLAQCHIYKARWALAGAESPAAHLAQARAALDRIRAVSRRQDFVADYRRAECGLLEAEWALASPGKGGDARPILESVEREVRASLKKNQDRDGWILLARLYEVWTRGGAKTAPQGEVLLSRGIAAARRAIELDPRFGDSHCYLGVLMHRRLAHLGTKEEKERATRDIRMALDKAGELNPTLRKQHGALFREAGGDPP